MTKTTGRSWLMCVVWLLTASAGLAQTRPPSTPPPQSTVNNKAKPNSSTVRTGSKTVVLQGKAPSGRIVNTRAPIPFKPFERLDLKTGKPIAMVDAKGQPTTMTLPNGRRVVASKYYDTLDKTEQHLNSIGMTLREHQHVVVEVEPNTPKGLLQNQVAKIKTVAPSAAFKSKQFEVTQKMAQREAQAQANYKQHNLDAINAKAKDKADSISHPKTDMDPNYNNKTGGPPPSAAIAVYNKPAPQFSGTDQPEPVVLGDPAYASFTLSTKLIKNMSPLTARFGVEGSLGLTLLSQPIEPAVVTASFYAPLVGTKGFSITAKAPYAPAIAYNKPSAGLEIKGDQSADLNGEVRATVVLGIIPVTFAAGIRGKAGIEYGVAFVAGGTTPDNKPIDNEWYTKSSQQVIDKSSFSVGLKGHADVFANATMYASAVAGGEIDLGLCTVGASLGVETDMILFDGRVVFDINALMEKPASAKAHGYLTYSGTYVQNHAMEGELFIEATLDFCIKSVTYRYYLLRNAGLGKQNKLLFAGAPEGDIF